MICRLLTAAFFVCVAPTAMADFVSVGHGVKVQRDLAYVANGDPAEKLDLYLPERPTTQPLPLLIYVHGGGWSAGTKMFVPGIDIVASGYAVASVEYRFSQVAKFPAQIQDCQAALRWLRGHASTYRIDPDHIGAFGDSAGAHLVALMGTSGGKNAFPPIGESKDQSDRLQAVVDYYGPSDFLTIRDQIAHDKVKNIFDFGHGDPFSELIGADHLNDLALAATASPVHFVSKESPPFLIFHGTVDRLVPVAQSREFAAALKAAGVDVDLQIVEGGGHGGPLFITPAVTERVRAFFAKNLKKATDVNAIEPASQPSTLPVK